MIRLLLLHLFCLAYDIHDTGRDREGTCRRCHLRIDREGNAVI